MKKYSYTGTLLAIIFILIMVVVYKFILNTNENAATEEQTEEVTMPTFTYEPIEASLFAGEAE